MRRNLAATPNRTGPPPQLEPRRPLERVLRFLARFKPPRRLRLTREGRYFLLITFCVGFAAINTGNNLLYLLFGMFLSLIIVSGVMSELSLQKLTVVRRLPPRAQVGRAHLVEIEVYNHKQRIPSYAIEVEDLRAGQPADKRCFFLKISPRSAQVAAYRRTPARRGRDHHVGFRLATRFPFGLFEKSRDVGSEGDLVIYPAVDSLVLPPDEAGDRMGGVLTLGRGTGDETFGVRPMRDGDDPRDIFWRKSAQADQMVVRERVREARREVTLVVESRHPGKAPTEDFSARFERRIREVASRAVAHLKRSDSVTIRTTAGERAVSVPARGADPLLRFLALLEAVPLEDGAAGAAPPGSNQAGVPGPARGRVPA
ncbi:MAG TPA: DUF58 domain-containing protein [Polyangiaceae bacterium]